MSVTTVDIAAAARTIAGQVVETPLLPSATLSEMAGTELLLKLENLQLTGSFKARGALNKLTGLAASTTGVVACSAGNHAQGVACFAARLGFPATIVMPSGTPFLKVERTEAYGAKVVLEGETLAESAEFTRALAEREGHEFIHPYDDPLIIAGECTVATEMLAAAPDLVAIVVPIGGGGLISGIAVAAKAHNPDIQIVGVEAELYPSMSQALAGAAPTSGGTTLAEGIAVKNPGSLTRPIVEELVDEIVLLDEAAIESAVELMAEAAHLVVEGAGATALGAVLARPNLFSGRKTGLVVSGGNIDMRLLATVLLRGLVRGGQLMRLRVQITDAPGHLARVGRIIGDAGGNVVDIVHQRMFYNVPVKQADLDVVVETRNAAHGTEILRALTAAGLPTRELDDSDA
ncbi:MAG: threonine ammonia-lyase [Alphaproteobacteria bacterium]